MTTDAPIEVSIDISANAYAAITDYKLHLLTISQHTEEAAS
jgi:hypothetical protein